VLSKRTIIGLIVGSAIIAIGGVSLLQHIGTITINENYIIEVGSAQSYTIPGDSFDVMFKSPGKETPLQNTSHKKELTLEWVHLEDGESKIQILNTGNTKLEITGVLIRSSDPIWFTFDIMVIITGLVIMGFSMGFSIRKPRGF